MPFDVEVWMVDAAPPASVQPCSRDAAGEGAFACAPLARVGSAGQVYRGALPPPADHFE
jgi:hypothetical protein